MKESIRVIDGGGNGFRRADVYGKEVKNLKTTTRGQITNPKALVKFVCANLPKGCLGISYAIAGEIRNGIVVKSPQIPWLNGYNLKLSTAEESDMMILVCNDMDGAAAGMATLLPQHPYFAGITWSSGIGLRVWNNGQILAPCEGGHIPLDPSPFAPLCGCGRRGCVESICGGESVRRRVLAETEVLGITIPKTTPSIHPCYFLDNCFEKEDDWAVSIYNMIAKGMGTYLASLQTLLRLPLVVWKGNFAFHAIPLVGEKIRDYMREKLINPLWESEMRFIFSPEPEKDSLIGAAALFRQVYKQTGFSVFRK